ncbi:protein Vhl-like [Musca vetustissima]|uniref:protein Vhl-like n=1 Tax=Musca vetustissima TaxID=27455 RepID=UPI002AB6C9DC|nr:protein Vhl-like [Musca vetustissima]XP_061392339.1 protein Vhl-like [Musca vetustissima]
MALEPPVQPPPRLAAQRSNEQTHVFFLNTTQRQVNLYWMDFNGSQDLFTTLPPGAGIKANTFVTHPWLFRDARTGERMHVKHQDIFWPQLYRVKNAGQWLPCRKLIAIHPPVNQSLRTRCLWRFSDLIYGQNDEFLKSLNLPRTLYNDIKSVLGLIEKHRAIGMGRRRNS